MARRSLVLLLALSCMLMPGFFPAHAAPALARSPVATRLVTGMQSGSGSAIGPDGALYVTEGATGRVLRVDRRTGEVTEFASGLPKFLDFIGIGGAMDVAFVDETAYVLVTLVGSDWGGSDVVGIYRVDGPHRFTVIADIGQWSIDNPPPPTTSYDTPTGVQYAMQPYQNGFIVTDGHHNRVLRVGLDGAIAQLIQVGDDVPTGLALRGNTIYVAQAGPVPHLPENGRILSFSLKSESPSADLVASGAPLLVDVEFGPGGIYALSQGHFTPGQVEGSPADPNTGSIQKVEKNRALTEVIGGLNQPTSLEIVGNIAYVVTLTGEIWEIDNLSSSFQAEIGSEVAMEANAMDETTAFGVMGSQSAGLNEQLNVPVTGKTEALPASINDYSPSQRLQYQITEPIERSFSSPFIGELDLSQQPESNRVSNLVNLGAGYWQMDVDGKRIVQKNVDQQQEPGNTIQRTYLGGGYWLVPDTYSGMTIVH